MQTARWTSTYFGPTAPKGFEKNWIPTVPGKAWFAWFRLYAPTEAYFEKSWPLPPLVRIQSGTSRPADAFTAIKYRDFWYRIDDRDFRSKGIFTFLMVIMTLAEKEDKVQQPVVTIPAN